jgi:hypothetical protein
MAARNIKYNIYFIKTADNKCENGFDRGVLWE